MKKRGLSILLVSALFILALTALPFASACAPAPTPTPPQTPSPTTTPVTKPLKIGALTSCWKLDYSWGNSNYRATMMLRDVYGCDITFIDVVPFADQEKIMMDYAEAGCNVIIAWGYEFIDAIQKVAPKYPDVKFVMTCAPEPGTTGFPTNIASQYYREEEGGYLAGMLAASVSKTKKIAYVSGTDLPCVNAIGNGFRLGAYDTDPNVKVYISYIGSWADVAKEKELTVALLDSGCDVILSYAVGVGIADVIAQRTTEANPIYFIGSQYHDEYKPEVVIATHYINHMKSIRVAYDDIVAGKFVGLPYECNLANGTIEIRLMDKFIPSVISYELRDKILETKQAFIQGNKVCSRLSNVGIRVMPDDWPGAPVANMKDYLQPTFNYVFPGHEQPQYDYLNR